MKFAITAAAVLATTITIAATQACAAGSAQEINGNWYCQAVDTITYTNFGSSGTYNKVTTMESGVCGSTPFSYGGTTSPMNEEVWLHAPDLFSSDSTNIIAGILALPWSAPTQTVRLLHARYQYRLLQTSSQPTQSFRPSSWSWP